MSQSDMPAPNATTPLTVDPALRAARTGARAYALMNSDQATTADELTRELGVTETELYAGIHAYLFVTTGCDLSPSADLPRRTRLSPLAVAA